MRRLRIQAWSLGRIAREMDGKLTSPSVRNEPPTAVSTDTRQISGGELFIALRGENFDGHEFIADAVAAGASAVVVDDAQAASDCEIAVIVVTDTLKALASLGHAIWQEARQQGLHTVAVTGSNGKTTTKEFLSALWGIQGSVWATPGNLNNHIGVPLTLCALPLDCDHLIVEMGANHIGEIDSLVELVPADERVITSIGHAHLEGFASIAGVRRGKSEIFHHASPTVTAILPLQEKEGLIPERFLGNVVTFGEEQEADIRVNVQGSFFNEGRMGVELELHAYERRWSLSLPFPGAHNARNLAAAVATLFCRWVFPSEIEINDALAAIRLPGGRLRDLSVGAMRILDDAYNANPTSMRASVEAFLSWCSEDRSAPRITVIGDMLELGPVSEREHRALARWLGQTDGLDHLAFVGDSQEVMAQAAEESRGTGRVHCFESYDELAAWLAGLGPARILLKGSRKNRLEEVISLLQVKSDHPVTTQNGHGPDEF